MLYRIFFFLFFFFTANHLFSQEIDEDLYREDQIYINFYYNSLKNGIEELKENKFSSSINFGFIRDIPLNKSGKFALGIGLGLGFNSYNNNLKINQINNNLNFEFLDNQIEYDKNKFLSSEIQIPLEIRLRNSSINTYKFWRFYAGIKYSRLLSSKYKFDSENIKYQIDDIHLNPDKIGLTLNIGFNTWNIGLYKAIRPFFDKKNNLSTDLEEFKVGLIFYIL